MYCIMVLVLLVTVHTLSRNVQDNGTNVLLVTVHNLSRNVLHNGACVVSDST